MSTTDPGRRPIVPVAVRAVRHDASAAVLAQVMAAGSSLALQLLAARSLGVSGYGTFSLYIAITFTITALQTGWVGDSLTVLDRTDRDLRGAIFASHVVLTAVGAAVAFGLVAMLDLAGGVHGALFAAVVVAWLCEDLGRRMLMARRQFWALLLNDVCYATVALGTVAAMWAVQGSIRLDTLLYGMLAGAGAASVLAVVQVPSEERWVGRCSRRGLGEVVRFAAWRSAQAGIRPGAQFATRLLVVAVAGPAALGRLEAARLLTQPLVVFSNGFSSYLLPRFSRAGGRGIDRAALARPMALLAVATAAYGAAVVAFNDEFSALLTGGDFQVERIAVVGWFLFTLVYVAALPATVLLVADRQSRRVFFVRFADSALGLMAVGVLLLVAPTSTVPFGLAAGAIVGGLIVWRHAARLLDTGRGGAASDQPTEPPEARGASGSHHRHAHRDGSGRATRQTSWLAAHHSRPWLSSIRSRPGRNWIAACGLAALVSSDYSLRQRDVDEALANRVDVQVLAEIGVYGLIAAYLGLVVFRPAFRSSPPVKVALWGFTGVVLVSATYALYPGIAAVRSVQLLVVACLATSVMNRATPRDLHRFAHAFLAVVAVSILVGVAMPFPRTTELASRFNWLYVHPVIAAGYLCFAALIAVHYLCTHGRAAGDRPWPRWAYGALLALTTAALLATRTRGSIAATAIGAGTIIVLASPRRRRVDLALISAVAVPLVVLLAGDRIAGFLARGESIERISTLNARTTLWSSAWEVVTERPLLGTGFFSARGLFLDDIGLGGAHNAYLEVLVSLGLIGLAWWLGLLVTTALAIRQLVRSRGLGSDGCLLAGLLAAIAINGLTTEGAGSAATVQHVFLFLTAGWAGALLRLQREERRHGHTGSAARLPQRSLH